MQSETALPRGYAAFLQRYRGWIVEKANKLGIEVADVTQQLFLTLHNEALDLETPDDAELTARIRYLLEQDLKPQQAFSTNPRFLAIDNAPATDQPIPLTISLENLKDVASEPVDAHDPSIFRSYIHALPSYQNPVLRNVLNGVMQRNTCGQMAETLGITHFRVNQIINELSDKIASRNPWDMDRDARAGAGHPVTLSYVRIADLEVPPTDHAGDLHELENLIVTTGYLRPVIVNQEFVVIEGAEFVLACANLGIEHVPYIVLPTPPDADGSYLDALRARVENAQGKQRRQHTESLFLRNKLIPEILGEVDAGLVSEKVARALAQLNMERQERLYAVLHRAGIALLTEADAIRLAAIRIRPGKDIYFEDALKRLKLQLQPRTPPTAIRGVSPKRHGTVLKQLQQAQTLLADLQSRSEGKAIIQLHAG